MKFRALLTVSRDNSRKVELNDSVKLKKLGEYAMCREMHATAEGVELIESAYFREGDLVHRGTQYYVTMDFVPR